MLAQFVTDEALFRASGKLECSPVADGLIIPAIKVALDGLQQRQRVIADNVANINTPGFQARTLDFENALTSAVATDPNASIDTLSSSVTSGFTTDPSRQDGNNVILEKETLNGTETNLRYSMALRAIDGRFATMRDVLKGS